MRKQYSWMVVGMFLGSLGFSGYTQASEDTPAKINGPEIELFERAHSFAGSIMETPVFGVFEENPFGAKVEIRRHGRTLTLDLARVRNQYSGDIIEIQSSDGGSEVRDITTHIELVSIKKAGDNAGQIVLNIDGENVLVKVSGESFEQGHFQSPHFETTLGSKTITFDFTGRACFGYSANIAMMILSTYVHLNK